MANQNAKVKKDADMKAEQYRKEAKMGGMDSAAPADLMQEMADKKARSAAEKAPTTRTEMGKPFKAGGMVSAGKRADGCATKGKTRGKMV
jgi:hypothetical protein